VAEPDCDKASASRGRYDRGSRQMT